MKANRNTIEIEYTEEQLAMAEVIVNENTVENKLNIFYLTLGQSDNSKDVRFVLYRLNLNTTTPHVNPFKFCCVLSDNLIEAAHKAKSYCGSTPIVIDFGRQNAIAAYAKWTPDVVRFGKNYGLKLSECEPKFIVWVAKGCPLFSKEHECWCNHKFGGEEFMLTAQNIAIEMQLGNLVNGNFLNTEQYEKYVAKQAILNSLIYGHHDEVGKRITKELTIVKVAGFDSQFGHTDIITFMDDQKKVYVYKGGSYPADFNVGDKVTLTATIKHDSYKEQQTTYLQRLKIVEAAAEDNQDKD